jgi:hypothetical protein
MRKVLTHHEDCVLLLLIVFTQWCHLVCLGQKVKEPESRSQEPGEKGTAYWASFKFRISNWKLLLATDY